MSQAHAASDLKLVPMEDCNNGDHKHGANSNGNISTDDADADDAHNVICLLAMQMEHTLTWPGPAADATCDSSLTVFRTRSSGFISTQLSVRGQYGSEVGGASAEYDRNKPVGASSGTARRVPVTEVGCSNNEPRTTQQPIFQRPIIQQAW